MASASPESRAATSAARERVATLEAGLRRSERRREAAEQWADLLAAELEARDERIEDIVVEHERQLEVAERDDPDPAGLPARSTGWVRAGLA